MWLPTGSQPPWGILLLLCPGGLPVQVEICSPINLNELLQGHSLPCRGLHHRLQGNLCFCAWSTFCPPSSLTLVFAELFLSHILIFHVFFPPFLIHYPRGATAVVDALGLGSLGAGWHWLYQTQGNLLAASHRSHPCSLLRYQNLTTQTQCKQADRATVWRESEDQWWHKIRIRRTD